MGFLSSLSGSSQRKDAKYGLETANTEYDEGLGLAMDEINLGHNQANNLLNPYIQSGQQGMSLYGDALGAHGLEAQQGYFDNFQNDPGFQAESDYGQKMALRGAAAAGTSASGRTLTALADRAQMHQRSAFSDRMDRLSGLSQMGQQAATSSANFATNAAQQRADLQYGNKQLRANNFLNYANTAAGTKSQGAGNMLSLASLGAKAAGGFR